MLRAAAVDGRIGPGSIPAVLQGRGAWNLTSFVPADVPGAPAQPVWECSLGVSERNAYCFMTVPRSPIAMVASFWARGTGQIFPYATKDMIHAVFAGLPSEGSSEWQYFQSLRTWTGTPGALMVNISARPGTGLVQACGFRLSIIGAMSV